MTPSLDEILAQAENPAFVRVATARILLRQDLVTRHAELDAALQRALVDDAGLNREPVAPDVAKELEDLEAEMVAAEIEFRFRAVGKRRWADLLAKHPPTAEQLKRDRRVDHNPATFPVAAIAAASIEPALSEDEVRRLEAALNATQFDKLWAAVIEANVGGATLPKSMAAGAIRRTNERFGGTAAHAASLEASSSDE